MRFSKSSTAVALTAVGLLSSQSSALATGSVTVNPSITSGSIPTGTASACAAVSSLAAGGGISSKTEFPIVPASVAYECLKSVPIDKDSALAVVSGLWPYFQWQSTLAYLKNPPKGYQEPPVDILGGLNDIASNVTKGVYSGEYDFQMDILRLTLSAHDGHFIWIGDAVGNAISFGRQRALVSVSVDGQALPKIYIYEEIFASAQAGSTNLPSAVTKINGQDVVTFLENLAQFNNLQDPDAAYNSLFYDLAQVSLLENGQGPGFFAGGDQNIGGFFYPGPSTSFTFENGTTSELENYAIIRGDFSGVDSGEAYYEKFCNGPAAAEGTATPTATYSYTPGFTSYAYPTDSNTAVPTSIGAFSSETSMAASTSSVAAAYTSSVPQKIPGYPEPEIEHSEGFIGGYYLSGNGLDDVAVLSIPSFVGSADPASIQEFQAVAQEFLAKSTKDGKKKLVIDLSSNGGGTVYLAYDLFKQLFPQMTPYGGTRFRAHQSFDALGQEVSQLFANFDPNDPSATATDIEIASLPFNYKEDLNIDLEDFSSWSDVYGPHAFNNDQFTSIIRYNLSDPLQTVDTSGLVISGYLNRTDLPPQPYPAEDIVLLYNGFCASTCAVFSEFMKTQGKVKSIAIGGRPQTGPMQGVGGTKGANDYSFPVIWQFIAILLETATPSQLKKWRGTEIGNFTEYQDYALNRSLHGTSGSANVRDNIRENDTDQTPLQFVYEAADCRLFYTADMTTDITTMWAGAANAYWSNSSMCIKDSTGDPSSLSGNGVLNGTTPANNTSPSSGGKKHHNAAPSVSVGTTGLLAMFIFSFAVLYL
ncbi:hypothetical protein L228DRAFT_246725 [Xylona heveae TC161]|uniref:Uncharacterized protein n=1 Tax=Xylona heveae (strain CBS 132557 / TC161) TaxID=1328760 RepID=A0A161TAF4_XYLHT|nr:hypothetical protein L228DRAFT_246725 [Xylona heveae TC161]KZF23881.1 hypothetical protein L228DRAFT_246725 [Xylona heveae TC161]